MRSLPGTLDVWESVTPVAGSKAAEATRARQANPGAGGSSAGTGTPGTGVTPYGQPGGAAGRGDPGTGSPGGSGATGGGGWPTLDGPAPQRDVPRAPSLFQNAAANRQQAPAAPSGPPPREPLNQWGVALLRDLPPGIALTYTAQRYPHIVNKLAVLWDDLRALSRYLDDLLMDDRPGRQGFAFEALLELTTVKDLRLEQLRTAMRGPHRSVRR